MSTVTVRRITQKIGSGGGGPLGGGLWLTDQFTVDIDDPAVPFDITMLVGALEGRLVCESFTVARRASGPAVVGTVLRTGVVLDSYLARIRQELALHTGGLLVSKPQQRDNIRSYTAPSGDEWAAFETAQRRDRPIEVAEVAELYRRALDDPDPSINRAPTAAIGRRLGVHRGHAARLVSRARSEGLLGPARAGRAGEIAGESS